MGWFDSTFSGDTGTSLGDAAPSVPGAADSAGSAGAAVGGGGGGFNWGSLLGGAGALGGGLLQSKANTQGANTALQGQREARAFFKQQADKGVQAIGHGADRATGVLQPMVDQYAPSSSYLRGVMARNPATLTPGQQQQLDDAERIGQEHLASSGLRGSGRAQSSLASDINNRYRQGAYATNAARSDQAAGSLANEGYGAATNTAQIATNAGRDVANVDIGVGAQGAQSLADSGATLGQSQVANGAVGASTLGTLGSVIAGQNKVDQLQGRYNGGARGGRVMRARGGRLAMVRC